ncbi:MAG: sporulation protein [Paracoccaceae bacterium]
MFRKVLASLGIGGASVDAVLERQEVVVGETLRGEVRIETGSVEQEIREVALELVTSCLVEPPRGDDKVRADITVASARVNPGRIGAGERRAIPIAIEVPVSAPLSVGSTSTRLKTRLDVAGALDPGDSDRVVLAPNRAMRAVFDGLRQEGFRLAETEVEYDRRRANPFVQEFDFKPSGWGDWGVEEVEIAFSPARGGIEVHLTVDNRGGFFSFGRERSARFRVSDGDLGRIDMATELRRAIDSLR